jgi:aryl-alcohol dehydrogenase-like predicted oxidoreductase
MEKLVKSPFAAKRYNLIMLLGRATLEATARYSTRHKLLTENSHFRDAQQWTVSSLGIGTYLGEKSADADDAYTDAVLAALRGGINVIDTSLNYRNQRSERAIGQAIIRIMQAPKEMDRDEFVVCTKAGYLVRGATPETLRPQDVVGGMHSLAPAFLSDQLERSRLNLGIETIDVYYLHNPETQFGFVSQEEFYARLQPAFEFLESAVSAGKIQYYGAATWEGFRKPHALSLTGMDALAKQIAGPDHHFRFIQLPYNLAMAEAYSSRHESLNGTNCTVLEAARELGISVVASASILQSKLAKDLPEQIETALPGLTTDAQRAIQFSRSAPGITTSLVGMGSAAHVIENLGVANVPPLPPDQYQTLFRMRV